MVTVRAEAGSSDAPLATLSWTVPCIDDVRLHRLRNYTGNVSRKKAFLSREGLRCYDAQRCVRGVVDGFASAREVSELRDALAPKAVRPPHGGPASGLNQWRWEVPAHPPAFRDVVRRAQGVLEAQFGQHSVRFYRCNIITWQVDGDVGGFDGPARAWTPRSLHGDTNTDEMFVFTCILYLSEHGVDVVGGETGIADEISWQSRQVTAGLRVQPSLGRLLVFSAGAENMHEMLPVVAGGRVAMQFWFACEGMQPGWARPQRVAWEAEHGWGGPEPGDHEAARRLSSPSPKQ